MKLYLARYVKDNKNSFYKYIGNKRDMEKCEPVAQQ